MPLNNYTDEEIIQKIFQYELESFIPYYESERSGGFNVSNSNDCDDCVSYIDSQWPSDMNNDTFTIEGPKILLTAPHATSQYRGTPTEYRHDCGITQEECAQSIEEDFDIGHSSGCCGKEPDHYTAAIVKIVSEMTGMPAIFQVRKDIDPNKYDTSNYGNASSIIKFKDVMGETIINYPTIYL